MRLLHSHIRIGSFQRLAYLGQQDNIEKLLRHVVSHYYPQIDVKVPIDRLIISFLEQFSQKVGVMVAGWMAAGFVHGVLNTDNFNITGESFDYGPWRFLPAMDTSFTAAYFDQQSRYAYGRQPEAALWALCRLADCFLPFISAERLGEALSDFYPALETEIAKAVFWRLGLQPVQIETAIQITPKLFKAATQSQIGWDLLFKELYAGYLDSPNASALWHSEAGLRDLAAELGQLCDCGSVLVRQQDKKAISEIKSKPLVTLEISAMESLWTPIAENDDWQDFNDYLQAIRAHGKALHRP